MRELARMFRAKWSGGTRTPRSLARTYFFTGYAEYAGVKKLGFSESLTHCR